MNLKMTEWSGNEENNLMLKEKSLKFRHENKWAKVGSLILVVFSYESWNIDDTSLEMLMLNLFI